MEVWMMAPVENFLAIVMFMANGKPEFEYFHSKREYDEYMGEIDTFDVPYEVVYYPNTDPLDLP